MTEPTRPGRDPIVDEVAGVLIDWSRTRTSCDWEEHQQAAAVLAHLTRRGLLDGAPKRPTPFRELTPAARAGIVVLVLALLGVTIVVIGLLAWAAVAVWGQVLG